MSKIEKKTTFKYKSWPVELVHVDDENELIVYSANRGRVVLITDLDDEVLIELNFNKELNSNNSYLKVLGINKREAKDLVELFFEEIRSLLEQGHQIRLSGFGNFNLRDKRERPGRNPKTGKDVPITARRVVTFRAGQKLKARVEKYVGSESSGD